MNVLNNTENPSDKTLRTVASNQRVSVGDSKRRMLGFSDDATKEYVDKDSYRGVVIDVEKLSIEQQFSVIVNPETGVTNKYYYGYSSNDYLQDIINKTVLELKLIRGQQFDQSFLLEILLVTVN